MREEVATVAVVFRWGRELVFLQVIPATRLCAPQPHVFPETGPYRHHRGLFVGEEHRDRNAMAEFLRRLPAVRPLVEVILLEYYPQGTSPQGRTVAQIQADLRQFKKDYSDDAWVARQVFQLCQLAQAWGLEVWGVEQPAPPGMNLWEYVRWRTSDQCNQAFLDCADWFAQRTGRATTRFCLYGGSSHIRALKRLAPLLPAYYFADGSFVEVDGEGKTPDGMVVA